MYSMYISPNQCKCSEVILWRSLYCRQVCGISYLKSKYSKAKKCLWKKGSVVACWLIEDQILKVGMRRSTRQLVLTKHTEIWGKRLYIMMTRDKEWKSYIYTVKQWYVVTCFTRVIYIYANSPGLSGSLPHGWPKLPDKRKFGSVAHKKLQFSLHLFQNFKIIWLLMLVLRFLASFSCVMHVVCCKQKKKKNFLFEVPDR